MSDSHKPRWIRLSATIFFSLAATACGPETTTPIEIEPTAATTEALIPTTVPDLPLPTPASLDETEVSLYGIDFAFHSSLGEIVKVEKLEGSPCDSMNPLPPHIVFFFEFHNVTRNYGSPTLSVYSVQEYKELCPDPGWLNGFFDPLREAIAIRAVPSSLSGPEGARTFEVQRVRSRYLQFQNGAGIQAIVSYGQDLYFIERDNTEYKFEGLTFDGKYYVEIRFPITTPFLVDKYEPGEPQNEQTIPIPEHDPSDYQQFAQAVEAYNEEARMKLEALDASGFTPDLGALDALIASLRIEPQAWGD